MEEARKAVAPEKPESAERLPQANSGEKPKAIERPNSPSVPSSSVPPKEGGGIGSGKPFPPSPPRPNPSAPPRPPATNFEGGVMNNKQAVPHEKPETNERSITPPPAASSTPLPQPPPTGGTGTTPPRPASPPTAPRAPQPASVSSAANKAMGKIIPVPKTLRKMNTKDLSQGWMRCAIYGETNMWKSTLAAHFGKPEDTRIVLTRRPEQLLPLRDEGYEVAVVEDADALQYALLYPERLWPEWADRKEKTLVIDDATEAINMLLESAEEELIEQRDGKEVRDQRRTYREAGQDLRSLLRATLRKRMHVILVALAKVRDNSITHEETIAPDLPPSMLNLLLTELEFVFYIQPGSHRFVTDRDFIQFEDVDPNTNKKKQIKRTIFAKNKRVLTSNNPLMKYEIPDLRKVWEKIQGDGGKK